MKDVLKAVLKLIAFAFLLPLIIAIINVFVGNVLLLTADKQVSLYQGAGLFLLVFLFVYDFKGKIEQLNQFLQKVFAFAGQFAVVISYIVPFLSLVVMLVYSILVLLQQLNGMHHVYIFLLGFSLVMHWVLMAKSLYDADNTLLKAHYFLVYAILIIINIVVASLLLNWLTSEFSAWKVLTQAYEAAKVNYVQIYQFLFVDTIK